MILSKMKTTLKRRAPESGFTSDEEGQSAAAGKGIKRLRVVRSSDLLSQRKLCLVLDLDHTLLHTRKTDLLIPDEEYLKNSEAASGVEGLRYSNFPTFVTKLRPFLQTFLKESSTMFEMYVNTRGNRSYALNMLQLLDPDQEYFSPDRIMGREDNPEGEKSLALVPRSANMVIIVDDKESVWPKHRENLIVVDKYNFFQTDKCAKDQSGSNYRSHSQLRSDESESDGELARVLKVLRRVHYNFYAEQDQIAPSNYKDVRALLKMKPDPEPASPVPKAWSLEDEPESARWRGNEDYIRWKLKVIEARNPHWFRRNTYITTRQGERMLVSHYIFMAVISEVRRMNAKRRKVPNEDVDDEASSCASLCSASDSIVASDQITSTKTRQQKG